MSIAYFKKEIPTTAAYVNGGVALKFENVDGKVGVFKSTRDGVISGLRALIATGKGGVSEVSEQEFQELLKKKSPTRKNWREEVRPSGTHLSDPASRPVDRAVASGAGKVLQPKTVAEPLVIPPAGPPQKLGKFKPKN